MYIKQVNEELAIKMYEAGQTLEEIGKQFNVTFGCIAYRLKNRGIKLRKTGVLFQPKKYTFYPDFFEKIDSHEKAAIFGFICADGYNDIKGCRVRIHLHTKDIDYLEKINKCIQPNKPNPISNTTCLTPAGNPTLSSLLIIYSNKICKDLEKLGCGNNKSLTLQFPNINDEFLSSFMSGYFDGDGCIRFSYQRNQKHTKKDYSVEIAGSDVFCLRLKKVLNQLLNINTYYYKKGKISTIKIGGNNQVEKFMDWIYSKSPIKLDRKYKIYLEMKEYFKNYKIEKQRLKQEKLNNTL